jgi:hypothetical protein
MTQYQTLKKKFNLLLDKKKIETLKRQIIIIVKVPVVIVYLKTDYLLITD